MAGKRILIILGGIYHDFEGFTKAIRPVLEAAGHFVETTYDLDTLLHLKEKGYDLVLSYTSLSKHREGKGDTHPETLSSEQTQALIEWVRQGGSFLPVHSGSVSGAPNPALRELIGAVFVEHPPRFSFTVYPMGKEHPITEGIEAFTVKDEFYIQDYTSSIEIHMVAIDRGVAHPMVWSRKEGKGRVAYIAMGHNEEVWQLVPYQRLLLQAIDWLTE